MLDGIRECTFRTYRSITDSIRIHLPYNYIGIVDASKHHFERNSRFVFSQIPLKAVF